MATPDERYPFRETKQFKVGDQVRLRWTGDRLPQYLDNYHGTVEKINPKTLAVRVPSASNSVYTVSPLEVNANYGPPWS